MKRLSYLASSLALAVFSTGANAAVYQGHEVHDDRLIIVWEKEEGLASSSLFSSNNSLSVVSQPKSLSNITVVSQIGPSSIDQKIKALSAMPGVKAVYPDRRVEAFEVIPDDTRFNELWGLNNEDTRVDINAPEAWEFGTGSSDTYIGIIDSGIDYEHEDLAGNIWVNPDEIPNNGIDDDENGYVDDIHGIDTYYSDSDPMDDNGHGTHVAGTVAAVGDNATGIAGVSWNTKLIACKFLGSGGSGYASGAIECLDYMASLKVDKGINIVATNNSWGNYGFDLAIYEAIAVHNELGILLVAAAGNEGNNNDDYYSAYPASYDLPNIISVAALDQTGELAYFSNYGPESVDIAAPGVDILSSIPGDDYDSYDGTSMAAPHVSGSLALLASIYEDYTPSGLKSLLLSSGLDQDQLSESVGFGRLALLEDDSDDGAVNCTGELTTNRLLPSLTEVSVEVGNLLDVQFSMTDCALPASGQIDLSVAGNIVTLMDNGEGTDLEAGDGLFTGELEVTWLGEAAVDVIGHDELSFSVIGYELPSIDQIGYGYVEIDGTALSLSDDDVEVIELDFQVTTPMGDYDTFRVTSNGLIFGGNGDFYYGYTNYELPFFGDEQMVLAPYWDDLINTNGVYEYQVIGETPSRQFVIEYDNISYFGGSGSDTISFQVVFHESQSVILFNYKDVTVSQDHRSNGGSATIGFETDGQAENYIYNDATLEDQTSLVITSSNALVPVVESLTSSGISRVNFPITFSASLASDAEEGTTLEIDLDDGNGFQTIDSGAELEVTYSEAGIYTATAKATLGDYFSTSTLDISILELSELEQALIEVGETSILEAISASPSDYGYVTISDADAQAEAAQQLVLDDPESFGLTPITTTSDDISEMASGTYLVGASTDINILADFFGDDVRFVWVYSDGAFKGWSPDQALRTQLLNSGYEELTSISAGQGFWVTK